MATPDPPSTALPPELILAIFDHSIATAVDFDTAPARQQTLATWALVCRALARPAQAELYARPTLRKPNQLDSFVRALAHPDRGAELAAFVREVRIGGKEGWKEEHEEIFGYSEAVEAIVNSCQGLKELYIWGVKEGIHASAISQARTLETLMLWQTPLTRFFGGPRLRSLCLPSLRRLDGYLYRNNADRLLLTPDALPSLTSLSIDLDQFPVDHPPDLLHQLRHVSTAEFAPCGNSFPEARVYDCWETAYSISPPIVFDVWAPLPEGMTHLRLRPDPDRGGERYEPRFGIENLLAHLRSGPTVLGELRVPRGWEMGKGPLRELEGWCKEHGVRLMFEDLEPVRWGQDWWSDKAFWDLVDAAERDAQ